MRICIVGDPQELSAVYIAWLARQRGISIIQLIEDTLGINWSFEFDDKQACDGYVETDTAKYSFMELTGTFVRLNPNPALPAGLQFDPMKEQIFRIERRAGLHQFLENLPHVVVNRPSSGRSNGSKPYQMGLLASAGFMVPRWIVTNDAEAVHEFAAGCPNGVIYKSCSGLRSQVRRLNSDILQRLQKGTSPVVMQEYIPGTDVRIHTVKQAVFPTEVLSTGVDYRFEHEGSRYRATSAPDSIAELCCGVAEQEGLIIAGFDFRVNGDGQWYCLEVNPVPSFLPYEMQTGQPIGHALIDVLTQK